MVIRTAVRSRVEEYSSGCKGRNYAGNEVFDVPVNMSIVVSSSTSREEVHVEARCLYNTGGHGQRCKAAHPHISKVEGREVTCPYSFDLPFGDKYLEEHKKERTLANKDLAKIAILEEGSLLKKYRHLFV